MLWNTTPGYDALVQRITALTAARQRIWTDAENAERDLTANEGAQHKRLCGEELALRGELAKTPEHAAAVGRWRARVSASKAARYKRRSAIVDNDYSPGVA